jgi:hypothetical protein
MMFLFADNSEFASPHESKQDIFCMGGFFASSETIKEIEKILGEVKKSYSVPESLPLKWNMRDDKVTKIYEECNAKDKLSILTSESDKWREKIFENFSKLDIKLIVSGMRRLGERTSKEEVCKMLFINLIERVIREWQKCSNEYINQIVLDWEEKLRDIYCNIYSQMYYYGKTDKSFPLPPLQQQNNASSALNFSVCVFNPLLQAADLIIGCYRAFFEYCFKDSNKEVVKKLFPYIKGKTISDPNDNPLGWGIIFRPASDKDKIMLKLIELGMFKFK